MTRGIVDLSHVLSQEGEESQPAGPASRIIADRFELGSRGCALFCGHLSPGFRFSAQSLESLYCKNSRHTSPTSRSDVNSNTCVIKPRCELE